jgi:hypothetical protein
VGVFVGVGVGPVSPRHSGRIRLGGVSPSKAIAAKAYSTSTVARPVGIGTFLVAEKD